MSVPIQPVDGVGSVPAIGDRAVRTGPRDGTPPDSGAGPGDSAAAKAKRLLESGADRVAFGGRVAEFHYDESVGRIVMKVWSGSSEPREVVRQFPPEEYLHFVAKIRELLGVLFEETA